MSASHWAWVVLSVCAVSAGRGGSGSQPATYAERLGWPSGSRVVIFHVDDAGMSYDSNLGTTRAIEQGVATSTSIMMPCPWVPQFAAYVREHPQIDAGIHLTLTAEWKNYRWGPVAGQSAVAGLVDEHGYLWHDVEDVVGHATPDEFEVEIRAQLDKALAMGIQPTHLDSHMGTCFQPQFIERYVKVGIEKQVPILIFAGHLQHVGEEVGAFRPLL
ncbi:MAG: polysaccharide deacetylase family protein, partial [Phycisphaerales bacterium]